MKPSDEIGNRYGRLVVTSRHIVSTKGRHSRWNCKCDCGSVVTVIGNSLRTGNTSSCGCLKKVTARRNGFQATHGRTRTSEWLAWKNMHDRCYKPGNISFLYYGARGIKVCQRWHKGNPLGSMNFILDMGTKPTSSHSIDRIDVNGDYTPRNCRWATSSEQMRNRRKKNET